MLMHSPSSHHSNGRKTFSKYHYKVVPIFWNGKTWFSQTMDINSINNSMQMAVDNYSSQSWNKLDLSFEVVPQTEHILSSADSVGHIRWGVKDILSKLGYTKDVDYDGIIVIYNTLGGDGDFCCSGGKAYLGGSLATVSYDPSWGIIRHEIGHNFGHEHHMHNHYKYRDSRPNRPALTDGFDMMSGGNRYERSDFGLASKWFYNWVSDSNIVSMQPEGKTDACPSCVKSGTFTMKAFDDWWNTPGDNDVMGIHIPIMTQHDSSWGNDLVSWMLLVISIRSHYAFNIPCISFLTFSISTHAHRCILIGCLIALVWMENLQMDYQFIWLGSSWRKD